MRIFTKLWIGIGALVILSPLGLFLPEHFKAGSAWGEWGIEELKELIGYIPEGFKRLSQVWNAPFPDYMFKGWQEKGLADLSLAYIFSAIVGVLTVAGIIFLLAKFLNKKE